MEIERGSCELLQTLEMLLIALGAGTIQEFTWIIMAKITGKLVFVRNFINQLSEPGRPPAWIL